MGDNKTDTRAAIRDAYETFFHVLAEHFPTAKTGDLPPDADAAFLAACRKVAEVWIDLNVPKVAKRTAAVEMHVEIGRPVKAGERIWWVSARTPEDALAEILRESEELGFVTVTDHDGTPDSNGMVPAVITFGNARGKPRLVVEMDVTGWSPAQVNDLEHDVVAQAEAADADQDRAGHPDAKIIRCEVVS